MPCPATQDLLRYILQNVRPAPKLDTLNDPKIDTLTTWQRLVAFICMHGLGDTDGGVHQLLMVSPNVAFDFLREHVPIAPVVADALDADGAAGEGEWPS